MELKFFIFLQFEDWNERDKHYYDTQNKYLLNNVDKGTEKQNISMMVNSTRLTINAAWDLSVRRRSWSCLIILGILNIEFLT